MLCYVFEHAVWGVFCNEVRLHQASESHRELARPVSDASEFGPKPGLLGALEVLSRSAVEARVKSPGGWRRCPAALHPR